MQERSPCVLGIDLGTSTCQAAYIDKTGQPRCVEFSDGRTFFPSVVYFRNGSEPLIGSEAHDLLLLDPKNGVRHWKRHMGSDKVLFQQNGKAWKAEQIASLFLKECKHAAESITGLVFEDAVVAVPANYDDSRKAATLKAAKAAGFRRVALVHEPTSALLSRFFDRQITPVDGLRLVVDIGGGTTDISLVEKRGNVYEVKASYGIPQLGGLDFTERLKEFCEESFQREHSCSPNEKPEDAADLWRRCEEGKMRLNRQDKIMIPVFHSGKNLKHGVEISKEDLRRISKPLLDRILDCIREVLANQGVEIRNVVELIPIGGGSQLFCVREELEKFFNRPISAHGDPIHAVALGAVLKGWHDRGEVEVEGGVLLPAPQYSVKDVTAHAIGVEALDQNKNPSFAVLLNKGCLLYTSPSPRD